MDEILSDFKSESGEILSELLDLLEELESDPSQVERLEDYGQKVDRIMGGAISLAAINRDEPLLAQIGACAGICKSVGYRGSQIDHKGAFATTVIGLLLDMTESLQTMVGKIGTGEEFNLHEPVFLTILDRLKWVSQQFDKGLRKTLDISTSPKNVNKGKKDKEMGLDINEFLQRLGVNIKPQ